MKTQKDSGSGFLKEDKLKFVMIQHYEFNSNEEWESDSHCSYWFTKQNQYEQDRRLRDRNKIGRPDRLTYGNIVITKQYETESCNDAITCSNAIKLKEAMDDKIDSLRKIRTWILVNSSSNHQVIDNRRTYKMKMNNDGSVQRIQRLVARGFKQTAGVDYHETVL